MTLNISRSLIIDLLQQIPFDDNSPFNSAFAFSIVSNDIPADVSHDTMDSYRWMKVSEKLLLWDDTYSALFLDAILRQMEEDFSLSYGHYVKPFLDKLVISNPSSAWEVIKTHFEADLPQWRFDIQNWLKGGLLSFRDEQIHASIFELPLELVFNWIDEDANSRAGLISHACPASLDENYGDEFVARLLNKYSHIKGVTSGLHANFMSGGYSGPRSLHLKKRLGKVRNWYSNGFEEPTLKWIESLMDDLDSDIQQAEIEEERSRFE